MTMWSCSNAAEYMFPTKVDGIMYTFAITLNPVFDRNIQRCAAALVAGERRDYLNYMEKIEI